MIGVSRAVHNVECGVIHSFHTHDTCVFHTVHRFVLLLEGQPGDGGPPGQAERFSVRSLTTNRAVHIIVGLCPRTGQGFKEEQ